jgi:Uma2 family endonuclease
MNPVANTEERRMSSVNGHIESAAIPPWVVDLDSFSRWADSPEFPTFGRFSYLNDAIWADLSPEDPFTHNVAKLWISMALTMIAQSRDLGTFFADRVRLRNDEARLSTEPDGVLISSHSSQAGRIRFLDGSNYFTFYGTPDMVLEVVSDSSERQDRESLREAYYKAGVTEYWIADARSESPLIDILGFSRRGFVASRRQAGGWVRSRLFGRTFRLVRSDGPDRNPQFTLEHGE